jgi:gluconolactonase
MKWDECSQTASVFRSHSNIANGNTRDREGRLISCEHAARRVTRTEYDGSVTVIADSYQGKRLNSPNDVVVKSDGSIWFTDPPFGLLGWYEGAPNEQELPTNIYRVDGQSGKIEAICTNVERPNGLCFSPDERLLYVVESGATPRRIRVFDVSESGKLTHDRVFLTTQAGESPDGFRCDEDGNLWAGWGMGPGLDGVRIFAPDAQAIGHIHLPERCANLCFGGPKRNRLFMAASHSLYALYVNTRGATPC